MNRSCRPSFLLAFGARILFGLCAVGAGLAAAAPADWLWRNPTPLPYTLRSAAFSDAQHGVLVGDRGSVLVTADGGMSWTPSASEISGERAFSKIRYRDALHGLAVGGYPPDTSQPYLGFVMATADGGATWTTRTTVANTILFDVLLEGDADAIAVGIDMSTFNPVVLRSSDDGATWAPHPDTTRAGIFSGIARPSAGRLVTVGLDGITGSGLVLTSEDDGATWDAHDPQGIANFNGVRFRDATHGVALGVGGVLLRTDDGGATWTLDGTPTTLDLVDGTWSADGTLFVAASNYADQGSIVSRPEGGDWASWPLATGVQGIAFSSATEAIAAGFGGAVIVSHDGGASWENQSQSVADAGLFGVSFANARIGTAVGFGGTIVRTVDGGHSWTAQASATDQLLYGVSTPDATHGMAVGGDILANTTAIVGTDDGGATWTDRLNIDGLAYALKAVSCPTAGHCVAVGQCGVILRTDDGGALWSVAREADCVHQVTLEGVDFADDAYGLAVGQFSILRTQDGGTTWDETAAPTTQVLRAVSCVDRNYSYVVGGHQSDQAVILATVDGGKQWSVQRDDLRVDLYGVDFSDVEHGYAVALDGTVYATVDAGATWTIDTQVGANLYGVVARDTAVATVVGYANDHAAIMQRDDRVFADGVD